MKIPKEPIALTKTDFILEACTILTSVFAIFFVAINYSSLPDTIPTHFGFNGKPDAYGNKLMIFLLLGICVAIYPLQKLSIKYPAFINYPFEIEEKNEIAHFQIAFTTVRLITFLSALLLSYLVVVTILIAQGLHLNLTFPIVLSIPLVLLVPIAYTVYKRNRISGQ